MCLLLLSILAGQAADPLFTPPVIPTPLDPGQSASPYEARLKSPMLDGSTQVLDLESLSYVTTRFTFSADLSALTQVDAPLAELFVRQVAADPRWRLVEWDGALVAFRRSDKKDAWSVPLRGYHADDDGVWRAALRFTDWAEGSAWGASPLVSRADAAAGSVKVTAFTLEGHPTWQAVALSWTAPHLSLEIFEAGTDENLPVTVETLTHTPTYVQLGVMTKSSIERSGYSRPMVPRKYPKTGEPTVEVDTPAEGELEIRAWVRPPGKGVTWARILDGDLKPWEEEAVATGTREIIGWSAKEDELFYLQGRFPVAPGPKLSGSLEIWHLADGAEAAARIGSSPVKVPKH